MLPDPEEQYPSNREVEAWGEELLTRFTVNGEWLPMGKDRLVVGLRRRLTEHFLRHEASIGDRFCVRMPPHSPLPWQVRICRAMLFQREDAVEALLYWLLEGVPVKLRDPFFSAFAFVFYARPFLLIRRLVNLETGY